MPNGKNGLKRPRKFTKKELMANAKVFQSSNDPIKKKTSTTNAAVLLQFFPLYEMDIK